MTQYIVLIHNNTKTATTPESWKSFFESARKSGLFEGGSEIGEKTMIGDIESAKSSDHIAGYMRFDTDDKQKILDLLTKHPVIIHGGSVELCEMPKS